MFTIITMVTIIVTMVTIVTVTKMIIIITHQGTHGLKNANGQGYYSFSLVSRHKCVRPDWCFKIWPHTLGTDRKGLRQCEGYIIKACNLHSKIYRIITLLQPPVLQDQKWWL